MQERAGSPDIGDHGFLSDCATAALVDRDGSVEWWCVPRFDSPSLFGRLLDAGAGHWSLRPAASSTVRREYVADTLVLRTVHRTGDGEVAITDALAFEAGARGHDVGLRSPRLLIRRVQGLRGTVGMETELAPRPEFGRTEPHWRTVDGGVEARGGPVTVTCTGPVDWSLAGGTARAAFAVAAGGTVELRLAAGSSFPASAPSTSDSPGIADTVAGWRSWRLTTPTTTGPTRTRSGAARSCCRG